MYDLPLEFLKIGGIYSLWELLSLLRVDSETEGMRRVSHFIFIKTEKINTIALNFPWLFSTHKREIREVSKKWCWVFFHLKNKVWWKVCDNANQATYSYSFTVDVLAMMTTTSVPLIIRTLSSKDYSLTVKATVCSLKK